MPKQKTQTTKPGKQQAEDGEVCFKTQRDNFLKQRQLSQRLRRAGRSDCKFIRYNYKNNKCFAYPIHQRSEAEENVDHDVSGAKTKTN